MNTLILSKPNYIQSYHKANYAKVLRKADTQFSSRTAPGYEYKFSPSEGSPKGIIHFVGGAFVGAAPGLSYSLMIELLNQAGYSVISTPYALTFQHGECARQLRQDFIAAQQDIKCQGKFDYYVRDSLPVFGVGHSNGALMHLLMGSYFFQPTTANVIISFNNKPVEGAIPVNLDQLQSAVGGQVEINTDFVEGELKGAVKQVGSLLTEVTEGVRDFSPSPSESRRIIQDRYTVPNTLLVKFSNDDLDETQEMYEILNQNQTMNVDYNIRRQVDILQVPGTHVTPCGPDIKWEVQREFNVQDALLMVTKAAAQFPIRNMSKFITQWLDRQLMQQQYLQ
eukprot:TRINITY_DN2933_c0_g1_i1.p2 TRINITY_DN2933_c0_g1~~TRINITY_DN2933_c0_g1_i1.p2  ORF type:complete len:338 (-),score=25.52 TRINITY_DN2933_c0_g1_i1:281-1294(-)